MEVEQTVVWLLWERSRIMSNDQRLMGVYDNEEAAREDARRLEGGYHYEVGSIVVDSEPVADE